MLNPQNKLYRWGPISACPLFMYFAIETAFAPLKKLFGITYTESLIIFKDNKVTWLLDDKDLGKQSQKFVDNVILNKIKSKKYFNLWNYRTKKLNGILNHLDKIKLKSLTNINLINELKKFSRFYNDWFIVTISLELAASSLEPLLGNKLRKYYKDTEEKIYQKAFSILTAPNTLTFYRREQKDLLKILTLPKSSRNKALDKHQKKYYWILNSYAEGKILSKKYFLDELNKIVEENYRKLLSEIDEYPNKISLEKEQILKNINITLEDKVIADLVEKFSRLMDERKMINFQSEHYLELFVSEISKRSGFAKDQLKYLLPEELANIFKNFDKNLVNSRKKCFALSCTDKKIEYITGENALSLSDQFLNISNTSQNIIHGQVASIGKSYYFRGTAKLVPTIEDINKINPGDILVTTMTSPDFVIGMKKAGAIITDTGGMLSHAAIVSRELKIPCIVGTEIATKVIHDGDVVELHCGRGIVRIIKPSVN
ncbi:hypothetical protein A2W14_00865 [Candidatus Gottesmanbacteria bacterium RBG_16_37_8]|uniref:PEP-utilising enzyme mobile domain-containing protein n=1 Tax=Candidatus Gottesmanbacteria bacterium RBG_16_37_8 TaxID=1798371 RepID=A0A1F5YQA3_9BACT|nr:MAG: hypothetical protein A2W14_00865 [Candidatus Gottesmanbacteria bacterium RBG_16_37_8]